MSTRPAAKPTATERRSAEQQAHFERLLTQLFDHEIGFNEMMGLKVESLLPGAVRVRIPMRRELFGHYSVGRLHGGVISAVLDALGGLALMVELAERHPGEPAEQVMHRFTRFGTIDLRVDYLRPGLGRTFVGSAEVTRLGGRVGSTLTRLHNDEGTLIATGSAAYVVS